MNISEKLITITENEQRVYQAGYGKGIEDCGLVGDDYVLQAPPKTIKTYTDTRSKGFADNAFNGYTELETVNTPNVIALGAYAFANCGKLPKIKLCNISTDPEGNSTNGECGEGAFANCKNLESVDFGYYYGNICAKCFSGCSKLNTFILRADFDVPLLDINAFEGTPIESGNGYIYVQSKTLDTYLGENAFGENHWLQFKNQFRTLEDYTVDGTIHGELDETKI